MWYLVPTLNKNYIKKKSYALVFGRLCGFVTAASDSLIGELTSNTDTDTTFPKNLFPKCRITLPL